MLQALERRIGNETFADQTIQLLLDILPGCGMALERRQLLFQRLPVNQYLTDQPADFLGEQAQARFRLGATLLEAFCVGRPWLDQTGARKSQFDQLPAQFVNRTQRHECHTHLRQARQVFFEVSDLIAKLQHEQPEQTRRMRFARFLGTIENAQRNTFAVIGKPGIAEHGLSAVAAVTNFDLHQFGKLAETPVGHPRVLMRRLVQIGEFLFGLATPLAPQIGQAATHAQLAIVLVDQLEVHAQMRRQRVRPKCVRRNLPTARIEAARLQNVVKQRLDQPFVGGLHGRDKLGGKIRHRHKF